MGFKIKIQNMVLTGDLKTSLELDKIVANLENIEYEPEQFPGVVLRIRDPKSAVLIFSSGKLVCTGTKSLKDAKIVIKKVVTKIRKIGIKVGSNYKTNLENIVASAALNRELDLDDIAFTLENTEYEPEQFPGLVYRMEQPRVTFLLFCSGRVICTGGRSMTDVNKAVKKLDKCLKKYK